MAALSKFNHLKELSLPYNCYEVGHTWTPFCSEAAVQVGVYCFKEALKIYTPLYLLSLVFHRKIDANAIYRTLQSILMSTCFLSFNAFGFVASICSIRKLMGKFYYLHCSYIPGFVANCFAILLERPCRRPALALYTANGASETLFRMAVERNMIKPIKNGEVFLFSAVMAGFLYFMRKNGFHKDFVSTGMKMVLGAEEAKCNREKAQEAPKGEKSGSRLRRVLEFVLLLLNYTRRLPPFKQLDQLGKQPCCPHDQSCFLYAVKGFLRPFAMSWGVSIALALISSWSRILKDKRNVLNILKNRGSLKFATFIGGFAGIFKAGNHSEFHFFSRFSTSVDWTEYTAEPCYNMNTD